MPEIYVPTSGIRLSKSLCKALEKVSAAAIVASVDSGTKETFEKVKGTKFFNIVQKNMAIYLKHAKEKKFVISKFILFTNYNDSAFEIEAWLKNCHKQGYVEVQFDSEHSVSSSEHCENKKYVNRTLRMLDYTERLAEKYNIKVTSYLAFMNRAKKIYEQQVACIDKFKYSNINFEDFDENKLDEIVRNEEFSPKRRVKMTISKPIIDIETDKLKAILRLGFDFDIEIKNYISSHILDEIIKTSYSNIVYLKGKNNLLNLFKINRLKNKYKKMIKLSKIEF